MSQATERRLSRLEATGTARKPLVVISGRPGQTPDEAWASQHGDCPMPRELVVVQRFCEEDTSL